MKTNAALQIRHGSSTATDERLAVAEIRPLIQQDRAQLILFFCSAAYDLDKLAAELRAAFGSIPTVGCTTAGQLGLDGFTRGGMTAISLTGDIIAHPYVVDLTDMEGTVARIANETKCWFKTQPDWRSFGLLLVDGLSRMEEELASLLYRHLPQVPIVGGSAGDDLSFKRTHVYANGAFHNNAAVFTLFRTCLPFRTIKFAHFVPTGDALVVTHSSPSRRMVHEINGEPAAEVYARLIGVPVEQLAAAIFSRHPLVFETGGEQYVRSIASANPDQSLTMFCAVEDGMILSLGRAVDPAATALAAFQRVRDEMGEPALVIGCDCILRRLEFEKSGLLDTMGGIMKRNRVIGFSTYGEQYDGLHVNQTFTGVAFGRIYEPA